LLVGVDGRVKDGRIFKSSGNAYIDEVALKNARETWKMEPATKNGEPVEAWGKFAMTFKIED
jgi:protein TonB